MLKPTITTRYDKHHSRLMASLTTYGKRLAREGRLTTKRLQKETGLTLAPHTAEILIEWGWISLTGYTVG